MAAEPSAIAPFKIRKMVGTLGQCGEVHWSEHKHQTELLNAAMRHGCVACELVGCVNLLLLLFVVVAAGPGRGRAALS